MTILIHHAALTINSISNITHKCTPIKKKSDKFPEPSTSPSLEAGHEAAPPVPKQAAQEPRTATSSSPPTSGQCGPPKPRPQHYKKRKTSYLNKPKVLYVGDSIAHNADFAHIEKESKTRIRTVKAYSSVNDRRAKWPKKNCTDITESALLNTREDDEFNHLVIAAPSVDITNIDTSRVNKNDNVEVYKQNVVSSCQNIFSVAQTALMNYPNLKNVVIMQHAPRYDRADVDPTGLKPELAKFANTIFSQMLYSSDWKEKITIGKHSLECPDDSFEELFVSGKSGWYDGIHLNNRDGKLLYTKSLITIFKHCLPTLHESKTPIYSEGHSSKANYQNIKKKTTKPKYQSNQNIYSVPVNNMFDILGN